MHLRTCKISLMNPADFDVVIFSPTPIGGLAEHTHYQADALLKAGVKVIVLTSPGYLEGRKTSYPTELVFSPLCTRPGIFRKVFRALSIINRYTILDRWLSKQRCSILLLEAYAEYFSPFWAWHLSRINRRGTVIGANLHDPIRDYRMGPQWWHDWSVYLAYRNLSFGLCHQKLPESACVPRHLNVSTVPVGVYEASVTVPDRQTARKILALPLDKTIYLSFGFIRDNKNLDLFIRSMSSAEDVFLLVAGRQQSGKDHPIKHYADIAAECGVASRVRFDSAFIPDEQIPVYFGSCNVVLLTYDSSFRSQSGVLNVAACYRKPVLASSGESPLRDAVEDYGLGCFVEPDNVEALRVALSHTIESSAGDWDGYFRYASWDTNVAPIINYLKSSYKKNENKI